MRKSVLTVLFASGASSLILELVWTRQFALVFGTTESALSTVLAAYMAGLAIGSYVFGRWCRHWPQPLWLYSALEAGVAVSALGLIAAIPHLDVLLAAFWSAFSQDPALLATLRFLTVFGIVVIPTTFMGGTLPVLCQASCTSDPLLERPVGQLYAANLAGAVTGTLVAGFLLIPSSGISQTVLFAVLLSLLAAMIAALAARQGDRIGSFHPQPGWQNPVTPKRNEVTAWQRAVVLACLGVSGYAALLEEVLWFRSLRLVVGSSTYALTGMLLTFLLGLALGSYLVACFSPFIHRPVRLLAVLQGAVFVSVLVAVYLYPSLPGVFLRGFSVLGPGNGIFFVQAVVAALVFLPTTVLLGALFPLSARVFASQPGRLGRDVGMLFAAMTCGNVLGAASSIAWLASLGLSGGLLAAGALHLAASFTLWFVAEIPFRLRVGLATAMMAAILFLPLVRREWQPLVTTSGVFQNVNFAGESANRPEDFFKYLSVFRVLFYREGTTATVSVLEEPSLESSRQLSLTIDGKADASTGADMSTQVLLAHLPLLVSPQAREICVIGWGAGITVGSVLRYPIADVTAIEIEPAVLEASALFDEFNHRPRSDSRLRVVVDDARAVLVRENRDYQVIISEPSNPWLAGPSKLFTREFLELGRSRLRPGGIFAQWIHLYSLDPSLLQMFLRTFGSVFPHLLVFQSSEGDLVLLGSDRPLRMDPLRISEWIGRPGIGQDLARIGVEGAGDVLLRFRFGERELPEFTGSGPLNTDNRPALEFGAARTLHLETLLQNASNVIKAFRSLTPYLSPVPLEPVATTVALRALRQGDEQAARRFAAEFEGPPTSARTMWLFGELARRQKDFAGAESWWRRGFLADPACSSCAVSAALALQQENKFLKADQILAAMSSGQREDPLVALMRGINRFYLGDRAGSSNQFRLVLESDGRPGDEDARDIIESQMFPLQVLAAFYAAEVASPGQTANELAASAQIARTLAGWRLRLFQEPRLLSWANLLSAIEFHAGRAAAANRERDLVALVVKEVLEPLVHFNRGIRYALRGDRGEAQKEFGEAARRVQDPEGQHRLKEAMEKLIRWQPVR